MEKKEIESNEKKGKYTNAKKREINNNEKKNRQ